MAHFRISNWRFQALVMLPILLLAFQNCSPGFSVQGVDQNLSLGHQDPTVDDPTSTPTPVPTAPPGPRVYLPGVNIAGAEINQGKVGAKLFFDYVYPNSDEINYFAAKGFKVIRIPFDIDRMQPTRNGELDATELSLLDMVVKAALAKNLKVILDPHNFGSFKDSSGTLRMVGVEAQLPASTLADFWRRMALVYKNSNEVYFGLMNEPHDHTAIQWKNVAVAAINAIRGTGATNKVLIPGTWWTGAHSWAASGNAAAWTGFTDINFAFEVHQYLDSDSSGTHAECTAGTADAVKSVTDWARANKYDLFLGEIGWSTQSLCQSEAQKLMSYLKTNSDVWLGYSYWTSGPWYGDYMFTLEPVGLGASTVTDRAQMSILRANF